MTYKQTGAKGTYLHWRIAERAIGKPLPVGAEVHHVDSDPWATSPRLVICQDRAYHKLLHYRASVIRRGGNPNTERLCSLCRVFLPLASFSRCAANKATGLQTACAACLESYRRRKRTEQTA